MSSHGVARLGCDELSGPAAARTATRATASSSTAWLPSGLAGRNADVGCGRPTAPDLDGDPNSGEIGGGFDPSTGLSTQFGPGYISTERRLPRKRNRVTLPFTGDPFDVCFIATPRKRSDEACLESGFMQQPEQCVRVLVALTDTGRQLVDERARLIELDIVGSYLGTAKNPAQRLARLMKEFGPDIVTLEQPDATPLPGTVGVFIGGATRAIVVTRRDSTRQFARWDGDVYSTNVPAFTGSASDLIRLP